MTYFGKATSWHTAEGKSFSAAVVVGSGGRERAQHTRGGGVNGGLCNLLITHNCPYAARQGMTARA